MTTLNARANSLTARANQAYREMLTAEDHIDGTPAFDTIPEAFEEGWETGYKQAARDIAAALEVDAENAERRGQESGLPDYSNIWLDLTAGYKRAVGVAREVGGVTTDE